MAIARDNSTTHDGGTASSFSFNHTSTGSNLLADIDVVVADAGNTVTVSSVTVDGNASTQVGTDAVGTTNARRTTKWFRVPVTAGTNSVSVTLSAGASAWTRVIITTYTGSAQSGQPNVTAQTVANANTSVSQAVTTTVDNCALVGIGLAGTNVITAGANTVKVASLSTDDPVSFESSPLLETPAGSFSLAYTSAGAYDLPLIVAAIAPAVTGPTNMKTWDGLATASIKTMDGLAIGSVKTWNGLT